MPTSRLLILISVFFLTSIVSVVAGSTSLITVPVMITLGIEAHVAVATNMLALTCMSVGGSMLFLRKGVMPRSRLPGLVAITIIGSSFGAWLLMAVPLKALDVRWGSYRQTLGWGEGTAQACANACSRDLNPFLAGLQP